MKLPTMDANDEVYKGYLLFPAKALIKNKWQQKYCSLYKGGKSGIARLEVWDTPDSTKSPPVRIITLKDCIKIGQIDGTHIRVVTKTTTHEFGTVNVGDIEEWVAALQSVAFPDDPSYLTSIEENNELYCSSGEGIFNVRIYPSTASERCGLDCKSVYILSLGPTSIKLKTTEGATLYKWPYCFIRRYGYKHGKFTFEAGRKCESGEGVFYLEHPSQQEIFRCLSFKLKFMKKMIESDSTPAILDCGDNQYHAALTMEARSRSPLPPSPTSSTTIHDVENNSFMSSKSSLADSMKNLAIGNPKPCPVKPPRKTLPQSAISLDNLHEDSSVRSKLDLSLKMPPSLSDSINSKYSQVEVRTEAWKTHGIDDVGHTEKNIYEKFVDDGDEYMSWGASNVVNSKTAPPVMPKPAFIIQTPSINSDNNYDKLDYFGSSSKLNVSSTYKQVTVASSAATTPTLPSPQSFNEYDEVQPIGKLAAAVTCNFEKRLADDTHLGYAQIRKEMLSTRKYGADNVSMDHNPTTVNHQSHNDTQYAVISKPKRV